MPESTLTDAVAGHYNNPKTAPPAPLRDERIERMLTLRTSSPEEFRRLGSVAAMEAAMYSDSRRAAAAAFAWRPDFELLLAEAAGGATFVDDVARQVADTATSGTTPKRMAYWKRHAGARMEDVPDVQHQA